MQRSTSMSLVVNYWNDPLFVFLAEEVSRLSAELAVSEAVLEEKSQIIEGLREQTNELLIENEILVLRLQNRNEELEDVYAINEHMRQRMIQMSHRLQYYRRQHTRLPPRRRLARRTEAPIVVPSSGTETDSDLELTQLFSNE